MTNLETIALYLENPNCVAHSSSRSLWCSGGILCSYSTPICKIQPDGTFLLHFYKLSRTTSRHQDMLQQNLLHFNLPHNFTQEPLA